MSALAPGEWVCASCTFHNIPARTVCEACNQPRPRPAVSPSPSYNRLTPTAPRAIPLSTSTPSLPTTTRSSSPLPSPSPASPSAAWVCNACTFHNDASSTRCDICGAARPANARAPSPAASPAPSPIPSPASVPSPHPPRQPSPLPPTPSASPAASTRTTVTSSSSRSPSAAPSRTIASPTSTSTSSSHPPQPPTPPPRTPSSSSSSLTPLTSSPKASLSRSDKAYLRTHQPAVDYLTSMGFTTHTALQALQASDGDREAAVDWIARNPPMYAAQSPARAGAEGPPITLQSLKAGKAGSGAGPAHLSLPPNAGAGKGVSAGKTGTGTPGSSGTGGVGGAQGGLSRSVPSSSPTFSTTGSGGVGGGEVDRKRKEEEKRRDEERRKRELAEQKEKELQAAKLREEERARLFAELKRQEDDLRLREKEARLAEVEDVKRRREEEERQRKLLAIQREREAERVRAAEVKEKSLKAASKQAQIATLDDAIRSFTTAYDTERIHSTYRLLIRILTSALQKPDEERLRSLKLHSEGIQRLLVRPVFGLWVLKHLGWREEDKERERLLVWDRAAMQAAQVEEVVARLQGEMQQIVTPVPSFFQQLSATHPVEFVYLLALDLHSAFLNVVTEPTERNFLSIDLHSPTYRTLLAPVASSLTPLLYSSFGYSPDPSSTYLITPHPHVARFEAAVLELAGIIRQLRPQTPVVLGVQAMLTKGRGRGRWVKELVGQMVKACEKVLEDVDEERYRRVRLDRVWKKVGGEVAGGEDMWRVMGWEVERVEGKEGKEEQEGDEGEGGEGGGGGAGSAVAVLKPGFDAELLRLRVRELSRAWKEEVDKRRKAQEEEDNRGPTERSAQRPERQSSDDNKMDIDG